MTNYQKFEKEVIEAIKSGKGIAVDRKNNIPKNCHEVSCENCKFCGETSCFKASGEWLAEEYKEHIVLTDFEKEVLKRAKKRGFDYIARDKSNDLYLYRPKPAKEWGFWDISCTDDEECFNICRNDFQFVKWEDDEPYNIDELLKENKNA